MESCGLSRFFVFFACLINCAIPSESHRIMGGSSVTFDKKLDELKSILTYCSIIEERDFDLATINLDVK